MSSLKSTGAAATAAAEDYSGKLAHTRGQSTNALRDPHASLHMMGSREERESQVNSEKVISPYAGHRPQQRSFADILGDEAAQSAEEELSRQRSPAKAGANQNYQPMRLFDGQEEQAEPETPQKSKLSHINNNPKKYSHFEFADEPDETPQPAAGQPTRTKHDSQFSFGDFYTPAKPQATRGAPTRAQDVRHWDYDREAIGETPAPVLGKGRRDAETHFELMDDGERTDTSVLTHRPRGSAHNEGLGLYKNNLFKEDNEESTPVSNRTLGNITNLKDRGKDFEAHWEMKDEPTPGPKQAPALSEARKKAVKMMDHNWSPYGDSPAKENQNANQVTDRVSESFHHSNINIAGDGMGGKKGTNRDWLYGGGEEQPDGPKAVAPKKQNKNFAQPRAPWED